ncbi:MAG TPA: hypothetical protein VNN20_06320 [Thermodesulfobacteriota bacterium]|nr:hypothetical protein [Thermodesulfobacteriota bacterium]
MFKKFHNIISLLLVVFPLVGSSLFITNAYAQQNKEVQDLVKTIGDVNKQVENFDMALGELGKRIEMIEKNLEGDLTADQKLKLAQQLADISQKNLATPTLLLSALGVFLVIGGFVLRSITLDKVKALEKEIQNKKAMIETKLIEIKSSLDEDIKQIREVLEAEGEKLTKLRMSNHWGLGLLYNYLSVDLFKEGNVSEATRYGELGLENLIEGRDSQKEIADRVIATAKANLAYYYAYADRTEMRTICKDWLDEGLPIFRKLGEIAFIETFLFVYQKFGTDIDELKKWLQVYEDYKDKIATFSDIDERTRSSYENHYKEIKKKISSPSPSNGV